MEVKMRAYDIRSNAGEDPVITGEQEVYALVGNAVIPSVYHMMFHYHPELRGREILLKCIHTFDHIFKNDFVQEKLFQLVNDVWQERFEKGYQSPLLFFETLHTFIKTTELANLPEFSNGLCNIQHTQKVEESINAVLDNPILSGEFKHMLIKAISTNSGFSHGLSAAMYERANITNFLATKGMGNEIILLAAVGAGNTLSIWSQCYEGSIIGVDIQMGALRTAFGLSDTDRNLLLLSDLLQPLPFPPNSVSAVVMESTAGHFSPQSLTEVLRNIILILADNGYIFVSPQIVSREESGRVITDWRVFNKQLEEIFINE